MKKPFIGLLTLSAFCASGATTLAFAGAPYQQPPASVVYDAGGVDAGQSVGIDSNVTAVAVTSNTGNGVVVIYAAGGSQYNVPFDPNNVHPTNQQLGLPITLVSQGLSAVAVDSQTNFVYAVGETFNGTDYDCLVKKYNETGGQVWSVTHDFNVGGHDFCNDIAVDANGDVIVGGTRESQVSTNYAVQLAKFDANGNFLADNGTGSVNCGPSTPCQSQAKKISVGGDGRVVVLAQNWIGGAWISAWDSNLQKISGYVNNPPYHPEDVAADANGNFYAVGWQAVQNNGINEMHHKLVKYNATYSEVCQDQQLFGSTSFYYDWSDSWFGARVASNGHVFVTGSDQKNVVTMEYDAACTAQWTDASGNIDPLLFGGGNLEIGNDIAVDSNGDLYITGFTGTTNDTNALTLTYTHN